MVIARRLYVYFISAVSLAMTAVGLANLMGLALARGLEGLNHQVLLESPEWFRRQLSLYAALVVVALPVWLLHWWLAERAVHRPSPAGESERLSAIRALYLTLGLAIPLFFFMIASLEVIELLLHSAFGNSTIPGDWNTLWTSVAAIIVTGAIMAYHGWTRRTDARLVDLEGDALWLPRLYLYGAAFAGGMVLLVGVGDLMRVVDDVWFGHEPAFSPAHWWSLRLSSAIARTLVGLAVWSVHWWLSLRLAQRSDELGVSERRSSLRWFYVYAIVFISILSTLTGVIQSLHVLLRLILGLPRDDASMSWGHALLQPLAFAIPFAVFWAYHRLAILNSAESSDLSPFFPSLRRLYTYLVAAIGLAITAVGASRVLGTLIDLVLGGSRTVSISSTFWRDDVATFGAIAIIGAAVWLWHWNSAEQEARADDGVGRGATIRRVYLYLALAGSVVAVLTSLAVVIYRVISRVLGVTGGEGLVSGISMPAGVVIVTGLLLLYHVSVLRQDLVHREEREAAPEPGRVMLILTVPPGGDSQTRHRGDARSPSGRVRVGRRWGAQTGGEARRLPVSP